ncbi:MAG: TonB-dependent receptor [Acidobacteria bacterium]|nr:TonB-dependent receptor [Acidobacteriota bacterium]
MRGKRILLLGVAALVLAVATPAVAQEFRGRITGTVTDTSGAVLPGATVTATSPALIQPQTTLTGEDGVYRLIALPAGVYDVTFDLQGFKTLKREGIRVVINTTLTINAQLEVAALQETVTVTGESPVVDTSTTRVGTNFTNELLTEIPNARDIWAAMSQAPGLQMTGYDVGGSHTGTQTGYITYGVSQQNTTRIEGVNTTEGTNANAGYFDFGSFEEFQIGGAGNMADMDVPGASLNITVKSGGDRFTGAWYSDWEGDATISDNVPSELKKAGGRTKEGFFTPGPLARGNPIDRQYDLNGNIGGPIYRGKAWFFYSYRLNNQFKRIIGFEELAQSKLTNPYTVKATYQLTRNNQIIGYVNKREKLQEKRDFGPTTPLSASYYQASRNWPMKVEWTSVLSSRMFLDALVGDWLNFFPLRPQTEVGAFPKDTLVPGRFDQDNGQYFDSGASDYYQDQKRWKPQATITLSYFKDGWGGSHDFKFGFEAHRDRRSLFNDQPFNTFYYDTAGFVPSEVEIYNTPVTGINDVNVKAYFAQDSWKFGPRLTLNLGFRVDHYTDGWPDQSLKPEGVPALAGTTDPRIIAFLSPVDVKARVVSRTTTVGPRAGFAYDIGGNGRSVIKGFYGRFYFNSADTIADNENPVGEAELRYQFRDLNGNKVLDSPAELGPFLRTVGGAGFVKVDPNLKRPYGEELSTHFEQEIVEGLSGRVSYIYKNIRDDWAEVDRARVGLYTIPFNTVDVGPDGVRGTADDQSIQVFDRPAGAASDRTFTNPDGNKSDYHTVEFALNRRFKDRWMALTSFEYTSLNQPTGVTSSTSVLTSAGLSKGFLWRPNQRRFGDREKSTIWNYKLIGRYVLPYDVGISGSYKLQSGRHWGRTISVRLPNAGSETIRVEGADARRAPNVGIVDIRFDKSFRLGGRAGRLTGMVDIFNLLNDDTVTNFRITSGSRFQEVIALLDPRIVRFGIRYEF